MPLTKCLFVRPPGPEVINIFPCSTQLSMKFSLLINVKMLVCEATRARGYKTFFMLNSAEHENFLAYECKNANKCWHFNNYVQEK